MNNRLKKFIGFLLPIITVVIGCLVSFEIKPFSITFSKDQVIVGLLTLLAADSIIARITSLGSIEESVLNLNNALFSLKKEFKILIDFGEKGLQRACTKEEAAFEGHVALMKTKMLKLMGIGASWLAGEQNRSRLIEMLNNNYPVTILLPDPCSRDIKNRYINDEPPEFELGLTGIATRIKDWYSLSQHYKSLSLKVYKIYPVATVTVYEDKVFVSPVLYKRRTMDNLTIIFSRPSKGAIIYESHFDQISSRAALDVDINYLNQLTLEFPNM